MLNNIIIIVVSFVAGIVAYHFWKYKPFNHVKTRIKLQETEEELSMVQTQKNELEMREKNTTDSLIYAQRIQEALLPSEDYFRRWFSEAFIYYRPKDIVSGDFYWIGERSDKIFIVAADCTGHGVPGALMSMIGLDIIDKAINVDLKDNPAEILSMLNRELEKMFNREKSLGDIIHDGMDIGICVIESKRNRFIYSGAFFPLYIMREGTLIEIKGDKLIMGMNPGGEPYTNHEQELKEGDIMYLFSDGYPDQFGGSENKKFMYRRFRHLLTTIHKFPVADQKSILDENMRTWMGNNRQIDDMLILGFRPLS
jgi:serine phosphatase RsbU (regulator of sigma subunit)